MARSSKYLARPHNHLLAFILISVRACSIKQEVHMNKFFNDIAIAIDGMLTFKIAGYTFAAGHR
jgi:hypothetical protein